MKKILFIYAFLFALTINAQTSITGLGVFKINSTKETIIDSLKISGYQLEVCKHIPDCDMPYTDYGKKIFKTENNPESPVRSFSNIPDYSLYYVNGYEAAGIKIKTIKLHFYKGNLFKIYISGDYALAGLLMKKYPEMKIDEKVKEIECSSAIAGNFKRLEKTTILTLRDDNIHSEILDQDYYDSKCKKSSYNNFTIFDVEKNKNIDNENELQWKTYRNVIDKKKNNLDEL